MADLLSHRQIRDELFALLETFDDFCSRNGLRYSLDRGTLLGAARHEDLIPWDDDADVMMPRPDYEAFWELRGSMPDGVELRSFRDASSDMPFIKFCNSAIAIRESDLNRVKDGLLWIDVFPCDGVWGWTGISKIQHRLIRTLEPLSYIASSTDAGDDNLAKRIIKRAFRRFPRQLQVNRAMDTIARLKRMDRTALCGNLLWNRYKQDFWIRGGDFDYGSTLNLRGRSFPVVNSWHKLLTSMYGDYSEIPEPGQRHTHQLRAWYIPPTSDVESSVSPNVKSDSDRKNINGAAL